MKHFSHEQLQRARKADLHEFLMKNYNDSFKIEGSSIRPKNNQSLSIKKGYCGYYDFASGDKGNSIDYLIKYLNFDLDDAVFALCGEAISSSYEIKKPDKKIERLPPVFPKALEGSYKNLYAYLIKRGISKETIQMLVDHKLIYQTEAHNNIVFVNKERDWGEIRGTYDYGGKSFHGVVTHCRHDGFWWFQTRDHPVAVYVCEAAIDAISLYELHRSQNMQESVVYVSIGGVMKQPAIDRLKKHIKTILAVDNDEAGEACRRRNPELESIIPVTKDWNEDLLKRVVSTLK